MAEKDDSHSEEPFKCGRFTQCLKDIKEAIEGKVVFHHLRLLRHKPPSSTVDRIGLEKLPVEKKWKDVVNKAMEK